MLDEKTFQKGPSWVDLKVLQYHGESERKREGGLEDIRRTSDYAATRSGERAIQIQHVISSEKCPAERSHDPSVGAMHFEFEFWLGECISSKSSVRFIKGEFDLQKLPCRSNYLSSGAASSLEVVSMSPLARARRKLIYVLNWNMISSWWDEPVNGRGRCIDKCSFW